MSSFNTALDALVEYLTADQALQNFCMAKWDKRVTIRREFRDRFKSVNTSELPIIMITRPSMTQTPHLSGGRESLNTVGLYILFYQLDRERAQSEVVEIEEKIDDCLADNYRLKDSSGAPLVKRVTPKSATNDEGLFHTVYGMVKDIEIEHWRNI